MKMIRVVNKRETSVGEYIGRPSPLGNPFWMADESQRDAVCDKYADWLDAKIEAPMAIQVASLPARK